MYGPHVSCVQAGRVALNCSARVVQARGRLQCPGPQVCSPNASSPNAFSPNASSPNAFSPNALAHSYDLRVPKDRLRLAMHVGGGDDPHAAQAGAEQVGSSEFWRVTAPGQLRFAYVTPVLVTKLMVETPGGVQLPGGTWSLAKAKQIVLGGTVAASPHAAARATDDGKLEATQVFQGSQLRVFLYERDLILADGLRKAAAALSTARPSRGKKGRGGVASAERPRRQR
eukprot:COSAG01_NODE_4910_length_4633_cov_21.998236_4_plen_228_part_00